MSHETSNAPPVSWKGIEWSHNLTDKVTKHFIYRGFPYYCHTLKVSHRLPHHTMPLEKWGPSPSVASPVEAERSPVGLSEDKPGLLQWCDTQCPTFHSQVIPEISKQPGDLVQEVLWRLVCLFEVLYSSSQQIFIEYPLKANHCTRCEQDSVPAPWSSQTGGETENE